MWAELEGYIRKVNWKRRELNQRTWSGMRYRLESCRRTDMFQQLSVHGFLCMLTLILRARQASHATRAMFSRLRIFSMDSFVIPAANCVGIVPTKGDDTIFLPSRGISTSRDVPDKVVHNAIGLGNTPVSRCAQTTRCLISNQPM